MSTRRLTRRDRARNAAILNGIVDVPLNHHDPAIVAYGMYPYPKRDPTHMRPANKPPITTRHRMNLPGKVMAWCNSPATRSKRLDRLAGRAEPILVALLLVLCSLLLALSVSTRLIVK